MHNELNLDLYNIKDWKEDDYNYNFLVETILSPPACPMGCPPDFQRFGRKKQLYMDTTMHSKRVGITVDRKRFRCKQCSHTYWETLPDMDDVRFMTNRLLNTFVTLLSNALLQVLQKRLALMKKQSVISSETMWLNWNKRFHLKLLLGWVWMKSIS